MLVSAASAESGPTRALPSKPPSFAEDKIIFEGEGEGRNPSTTQLPSRPDTAECLSEKSDIKYAYLTYETELPPVNATVRTGKDLSGESAGAATEELPPAPDPNKYTNPLEWPTARKNVMLGLACVATMTTAYAAGAYEAPVHIMMELFDASQVAVNAGISLFCLGFALAPMVLAPFSEINGRKPVFMVSGTVYVLSHLGCAMAKNLAGMLALRLLVGIGSSVFSTMVAGVIADLYPKASRNFPMAMFSLFVLCGTGLGPLVAGTIVQYHGINSGWRWVFWHQVITNGAVMIGMALFFKESRGSIILSHKARALNTWYEKLEQAGYYGVWRPEDGEPASDSEKTLREIEESTAAGSADEEKQIISRPSSPTTRMTLQRVRWLVKEDEDRASLAHMISISVYRSFHLLITEPVVSSFSAWVSFAWGVLYLTFGSIPLLFSALHGWDVQQCGFVFFAMIVGSMLATLFAIWQEELLKHPGWQPGVEGEDHPHSSRFWAFMRTRFPVEEAESRLLPACLTSALLPIGLFIFGFTSSAQIPWIAPVIGVGVATMGIYAVYLATFNYLADVYAQFASSALAAQSCCRNILGGVFPLVTGALFTNLGPSRAVGLLGGIACSLTLVPWVLTFYGPAIRARSKFAVQLESSK